MRRSLRETCLLYGTIAVLVLIVMLTVIIPAVTRLGDALQAGMARL